MWNNWESVKRMVTEWMHVWFREAVFMSGPLTVSVWCCINNYMMQKIVVVCWPKPRLWCFWTSGFVEFLNIPCGHAMHTIWFSDDRTAAYSYVRKCGVSCVFFKLYHDPLLLWNSVPWVVYFQRQLEQKVILLILKSFLCHVFWFSSQRFLGCYIQCSMWYSY